MHHLHLGMQGFPLRLAAAFFWIGAALSSPINSGSPISILSDVFYLNGNVGTRSWKFDIPSELQKGTASTQFNIATPYSALSDNALLMLDAPKLKDVTESAFDWWYYDVVSETDPKESVVVILFTSSATAFPWLDPKLKSVLVAYLWASFANGTVYSDYVPATLATVGGGDEAPLSSYGNWSSTGFSWSSTTDDLSQYEVLINSDKMQVHGRVALTSPLKPHFPCGIQPAVTNLEVFPRIGWASLMPDATGVVDLTVKGSPLAFRGRGYHDKNWSDRPFVETVQSWYWGHGRLGPYSIVWFNGIDTANKIHTSSYVTLHGAVQVASCSSSAVKVRPIEASNKTGGRYPPQAGDIPNGFNIEFDLGGNNGLLRVKASADTILVGDGRYYYRWSGSLTGELVGSDGKIKGKFSGVSIFEQFTLLE